MSKFGLKNTHKQPHKQMRSYITLSEEYSYCSCISQKNEKESQKFSAVIFSTCIFIINKMYMYFVSFESLAPVISF